MKAVLSTLVLLVSLPAVADIDTVVRSAADFPDVPAAHEVVRVASSRVVLVDYDLIAKDFPDMKQRPGESAPAWRQRVDGWLEAHTGFIIAQQAKQKIVNTEIAVTEEKAKAFRPKGYNRAHVIPVPGGLMDAKGVGTEFPQQRHHGNGLATLGEMIREYIMGKAVKAVMDHSGSGIRTVGNYAVVDFGFDVTHSDGSRSRAGYILRQAHVRSEGFNSGLTMENAYLVERTLRRYGLTSSGETFAFRHEERQKGINSGQYNFDYTNVQGTNNKKTIEIIDFGAFLAVEKFDQILKSHVQWTVLETPAKAEFIQPDQRIRLSLEQWGNFGVQDPKSDKPWLWSHELAQAWAEGRAGREAFETHVRNMVGPVEQGLNSHPRCAISMQ